jgi:hypothetical protein
VAGTGTRPRLSGAVAGRCAGLALESVVMLWEVAEPVREGRYEGVGASWKNGDTRVKRPTTVVC